MLPAHCFTLQKYTNEEAVLRLLKDGKEVTASVITNIHITYLLPDSAFLAMQKYTNEEEVVLRCCTLPTA
jgi:hypothetical protein